MSATADSISPPEDSNPEPGNSSTGTGRVTGKRGFTGILQIIAVIALVALAVAFSREDKPQTAAAAGAPATSRIAAPAPLVRLMIPQPTSSRIKVAATGSVEVRNYVALTPQIGGQVVAVAEALRSGGRFDAGDVLFRIDPRDYELALAQARAEVASAQSRLKLRQAEADAARGNYALLHGDAPVPDLVAKVPQIEQSAAELASARARVARAELDLSRTRFSLPFTGRIVETSVAVGQMLSKGQAFGQAFALESIEVNVPISQEDLARLLPVEGRKAVVQVAGREFAAEVDRASATLDERTRFAKLFLALSGDTELPPGTFVDVTLYGAELADTFVLPNAAEQASANLWLVNDSTLASFKPRIHGRSEQGLVVDAFDFGEGIVLGAVPGAKEGLKVNTGSLSQASIGLGGE